LERRLIELDAVVELETPRRAAPIPPRRSIFAIPRRATLIGLAAALSAASVAVALVIDHGTAHTVQTPASEAPAPTTATPTTGATTTVLERPTTAPPVVTSAPASEPTTAASPPPTVAPPVKSEPSTTATTNAETPTPATLTLACAPGGPTSIVCEWSARTAGDFAGYRILRSTPGGTVGRVFSTGPGDHTLTDDSTTAGTSYVYVVQAINAAGAVLEHTPLVTVACC